jgi:hypothetical protein
VAISLAGFRKGSALAALPFALAFLASPALVHPASPTDLFGKARVNSNAGMAGFGVEAPWTLLSLNADTLNEPNRSLGYPGASGGSLQMLGAGMVVQQNEIRWTVAGLTGGLSSKDGDKASNWNLDLIALIAEQRYPAASFEITAGFAALYGIYGAEMRDNGAYTRFESRFVGTGTVAGLRWPAQSKLSFFTRGGYFWLPASGDWNGTLRGRMAKTYYDLSAPVSQAGLDLIF